MASRRERITAILDAFVTESSAGVAGAAAVDMDGFVIGAHAAAGIEIECVGAAAVELLGVARRIHNELHLGQLEEAILEAELGTFMILPVGARSLLAISLRDNANLGLVRVEARAIARAVHACVYDRQ